MKVNFAEIRIFGRVRKVITIFEFWLFLGLLFEKHFRGLICNKWILSNICCGRLLCRGFH